MKNLFNNCIVMLTNKFVINKYNLQYILIFYYNFFDKIKMQD